jgi:hypothetical protein
MSRPFPLAVVARVRRIRTGLARAEVSDARVLELAAEEEWNAATAAFRSRNRWSTTEPVTYADFHAAVVSGLRHADDVERTAGGLEQARHASRTALSHWQEARTSERVTDRLEEAHLEAEAAAAQALEQRAADDRAGARWFVERADERS